MSASSLERRLRIEIAAYDLRYTCDDCAHFDAGRVACAHGYPTEPHRRGPDKEVIFCKEFELGS